MPARARSVHSIDAHPPAGADADRLKEIFIREYGGHASRAAGRGAVRRWTPVEDDAMLECLRQDPCASWERVAAAVGGRSHGACSLRFLELVKQDAGAQAIWKARQQVSTCSPSKSAGIASITSSAPAQLEPVCMCCQVPHTHPDHSPWPCTLLCAGVQALDACGG